MAEGDFTPASSGHFKKATRAQKQQMAEAFARAQGITEKNHINEELDRSQAENDITNQLNQL